MRHNRHRSRLNRTTEHRTALMRNLAAALIQNGVIRTTEPKAKQLRQFAERVITIARDGLTAETPETRTAKRRLVFSYLNSKEAVKKLFDEIAPAVTSRAGGYTRVVKDGKRRFGDGAPMAFVEIVDRAIPVAAEEKKGSKEKAKA